MTLYFLYYLLIDTFADLLSPKTLQCIKNNPNVIFFQLLHHIINCFILGAWIFNYKPILIFHIICILFTIVYWFVNKNLCDLTIYVNKICGWNENELFNDLLNIIGLKKIKAWNEIWHYIFIIFGGLISLYKIIKY
jgi:hypothetical protein